MHVCTQVKLIFVGAAAVGKSCLLNRLVSDTFDPNLPPTIGMGHAPRGACSDSTIARDNTSVCDTMHVHDVLACRLRLQVQEVRC